MIRNQISFFKVYRDRYSLDQSIVLVILLMMASLLVFATGKRVYKGIKDYNKLIKEGISTTAHIFDIALGGGRMGSNFVYYRFHDLNNRLIEKKEQVGRKILGRLPTHKVKFIQPKKRFAGLN